MQFYKTQGQSTSHFCFILRCSIKRNSLTRFIIDIHLICYRIYATLDLVENFVFTCVLPHWLYSLLVVFPELLKIVVKI